MSISRKLFTHQPITPPEIATLSSQKRQKRQTWAPRLPAEHIVPLRTRRRPSLSVPPYHTFSSTTISAAPKYIRFQRLCGPFSYFFGEQQFGSFRRDTYSITEPDSL